MVVVVVVVMVVMVVVVVVPERLWRVCGHSVWLLGFGAGAGVMVVVEVLGRDELARVRHGCGGGWWGRGQGGKHGLGGGRRGETVKVWDREWGEVGGVQPGSRGEKGVVVSDGEGERVATSQLLRSAGAGLALPRSGFGGRGGWRV